MKPYLTQRSLKNSSQSLLDHSQWWVSILKYFLWVGQSTSFLKTICNGYTLGMSYSLCKMVDFQNGLISQIFVFFSSGFLHITTPMFLQNKFSHVFGIFNFGPKVTILQGVYPLHGLQPLQHSPFSTSSHFSNIWCFFQPFFPQNNSNLRLEWFFKCFWHF